ncbi:MAG: NAD-glutamate dehydrogenase [Desulfobacterales bacterium]|nr:NAD-glutamate dehydrogenase [Desulfobacterales bacterium]
MHTRQDISSFVSAGSKIIQKANEVKLDTSLLYETVIDLASEGLITASSINQAAWIFLNNLGLPGYYFETITKMSLKNILASIARGIKNKSGKVELHSWVAGMDFDTLSPESQYQRVRIATQKTRDNMEKMLGHELTGRRRDYYYNPDSEYYTHIFWPEKVSDFSKEQFETSRFLFNIDPDFKSTPLATRKRYEKFLDLLSRSVIPPIEVFNLSDIGETRFMFNSDFKQPQINVLRKLFSDHGLPITRAYWEPYYTETGVVSSICSLYIKGEVSRKKETDLTDNLRSFLSFCVSDVTRLYVDDQLTFKEMLFAGNAVNFVHMFIFKERGIKGDRHILGQLTDIDSQEAFSERVHESNKFTYVEKLIIDVVLANPDLIQFLYELFEEKFNPAVTSEPDPDHLDEKEKEFDHIIASRFMDYAVGYDIFKFMFKFIPAIFKTNFYKPEKRSFSFRMDNRVLDPMVFKQPVFGVFFVNGHYAQGTHLRADDIARGGLRMVRVTPSNYARELDNAVLLNYALGPKAQRLKHKDICESGSKGVVVPHVIYATCGLDAIYDYTEGIMDLMLPDIAIRDYYGKPEMIFFGPDEGTAPFMDKVAFRAREKGYTYWRTITTGKSFGIPHDTYGKLDNGDLFGLIPAGENGTELQINGEQVVLTTDMEKIYDHIGGRVEISGMTTTSVMGAFRTLVKHYGEQEENLNLMMTGGPDGDLGSNEIQCYKGKICLIIDGGSILYDPDGLDKKELMKIAFMRHTSPRANSLAYPIDMLGTNGFKVPLKGENINLPDGTVVKDGALFHRNFITNPASRKYIEQANIRAFIPCGGFKDTINHDNVRAFTELFKELCFVVEGANVFFDDASRRFIARETSIKQIKDSSANKGGVFSSAVAEVLTAFLFEDDYEKNLIENPGNRWELIEDIISLVNTYAALETNILIKLHEADLKVPLFVLSEKTSEQIFAFQKIVDRNIDAILTEKDLLWQIMRSYIPKSLIEKLGRTTILDIMNRKKLTAYRNAIISKKIASKAFYKHGMEWSDHVKNADKDFMGSINGLFEN